MCYARDMPASVWGERRERCRWQMKRPERVAVVDKIEDQRKPEDFIGHHNRTLYHIAAAKQLYRICCRANISRFAMQNISHKSNNLSN